MATHPTPAEIAKLPPSFWTEDVSAPLMKISIAFLVLQTVFYFLFCISRYLNNTATGVEFWILHPLAYITCMAHCVNSILMVQIGGAGRRALALAIQDPEKIVTWLKLDKSEEYIYMASITFPKLAILCLYVRIFNSQGYLIATYFTGGLIVSTFIIGIIMSSLICIPFAYHWDKNIPGGQCGDIMAAYRYISVPNITTDFLTLILPLPALWRLHVETGVKLGLFVTFTIGSFGIVTCLIRAIEFFTRDLFDDPTYKCIPVMIWTVVEPGVYLIAGCMPSLRPLQRRFVKHSLTNYLVEKCSSTSKDQKKSWRQSITVMGTGVLRTTEIEMKSSRAPHDEEASVNSTTMMNGQSIEMEDYNHLTFLTTPSDHMDDFKVR